MNIVSFGGGTNSAALLIGLYKHKIPIDLITFADTGAEHPHTYQFIEIINQWLAEHGMPQITVVQYVDRYGNRLSLETECLRSHTLPSIAYGHKRCSQKHKIAPQEKFCNHYAPCREVWQRGEKVNRYRVLSLDETCRELNRKYILPIGYERNNMFLTDWSEEEFAELDFYDMFDLFYQENHTANGEFTFGNAMGTSAVYLISKEKFEPVIKSKFKISSEVLQSKTVYYPCEEVYEYKPRGLEETEYPEYPYPEVIGYVNNDDGTLTLKVQAVFPYRGVSKAYIHEVTVRDTKDGGIQYVGNRIIEPINNPEIRWHVPRLTRTEWEELYGDN